MKRAILVTLSVFLAGSLAQAQEEAEKCPIEKYMVAQVKVFYGDAYIRAVPELRSVCVGGKIVFTMVPVGNHSTDYEKVEVLFVGEIQPDKWLDRRVVAADLPPTKQFEVVVDPAQVSEGTYKYEVIVPNVGKLDPRIEVLP